MTDATRPSDTARARVLADDRVARVAALVARLTAAALWLTNLSWKRPPDFGEDDDAGLYFFTRLGVEHPVFAPWTAFIESVVLPNIRVFGWITLLTEGALAVLLLLGLATRLVALVGVAQSFAIFLTVSAAPEEWYWSYLLMMALHLAILGMAAGRVLGLDALVRRRVEDAPGTLPRLLRIVT